MKFARATEISSPGVKSNRGDGYQRAVATRWLAEILSNDDIEAVLVEAIDTDEGDLLPVDDVVVFYRDGSKACVQAKRSAPRKGTWTFAKLKEDGELAKLVRALDQHSAAKVIFASASPFPALESSTNNAGIFTSLAGWNVAASKAEKEALLDFSKHATLPR